MSNLAEDSGLEERNMLIMQAFPDKESLAKKAKILPLRDNDGLLPGDSFFPDMVPDRYKYFGDLEKEKSKITSKALEDT